MLEINPLIKIGTDPHSSGLGDILLLTPICREFPDSIVELIPKAAERFGCLFDGIAEVVATNKPTITKDIGGGHYCKRKLRSVGVPDANYLPYIKITEEEKNWATCQIREYPNPIIFAPNTSRSWKHCRELNPSKWQEMLDQIALNRTILQFGVSDNFTYFEKTVKFKDVHIRKTAAIYSVVKEYIGVNTGDMHLMVSVGGFVHVLTPPNGYKGFSREEWEYDDSVAKYVVFEKYRDILTGINAYQ